MDNFKPNKDLYKNGKIVRLTGTENILDRVDLDPNYPLLNKQILNEDLNVSLVSFYSFKNPNLYDLPVRSEFKFLKMKKSIFSIKKWIHYFSRKYPKKMIFTGVLKIITG